MFHPQGLRAPATIPTLLIPGDELSLPKGNLDCKFARPQHHCSRRTPFFRAHPGTRLRHSVAYREARHCRSRQLANFYKNRSRKDASPPVSRQPRSVPCAAGFNRTSRFAVGCGRHATAAVRHGFCRLKGKKVQSHRNGGAAEPWKSSLLLKVEDVEHHVRVAIDQSHVSANHDVERSPAEEEASDAQSLPDSASASSAVQGQRSSHSQLLLESRRESVAFRQARRQLIVAVTVVVPVPHGIPVVFAVVVPPVFASIVPVVFVACGRSPAG